MGHDCSWIRKMASWNPIKVKFQRIPKCLICGKDFKRTYRSCNALIIDTDKFRFDCQSCVRI